MGSIVRLAPLATPSSSTPRNYLSFSRLPTHPSLNLLLPTPLSSTPVSAMTVGINYMARHALERQPRHPRKASTSPKTPLHLSPPCRRPPRPMSVPCLFGLFPPPQGEDPHGTNSLPCRRLNWRVIWTVTRSRIRAKPVRPPEVGAGNLKPSHPAGMPVCPMVDPCTNT